MELGAHLPLITFTPPGPTLADLRAYARTVDQAGFRFLCVNDHLVFSRPWLDGPSALAAVLADSGSLTLATTIALPVVRGPVATAKTLASIDSLSGGRLVAGVGPGSSARDYAAVGLPFGERWARFDEAVQVLRALLDPDKPSFAGTYYSTHGIDLEPAPATPHGPPIWIASWGSDAGLRRVKRLGDGWLASGYNVTPELFAKRLKSLPDDFPNAVGTLWMYVTDSRREKERVIAEVLAPAVAREPEALAQLALPIGSVEDCLECLQAWSDAGAQHAFVWPLDDPLGQLTLFAESIAPRLSPAPAPRPSATPAPTRLALMESVFERFAVGDFAATQSVLDPAIVLVIDDAIPESGAYLGLDGVQAYMTRFLEPWERLTINAVELHEAGDTIVARCEQRATGRGSRAPVELNYFQLWTFRGGKVVRLEITLSEQRALDAVSGSG
jgi:alkanesulfonate monooxygenase SsuD/methylene tetrahydromethanopterin reductase-like flavin-dependent oxidoreductase (luciferase family)/ketosteroid isomerase-like protein